MPDVLPGQTTLGVLRKLVSRETDQPTPSAQTNATMDDYDDFINRSYREVTGLLVDSFQDYYVNPDTGNPFAFLTAPPAYLYPLPNDFWKLLGVDCLWSPGQVQTAITMRPFMQLERNKWQGWGVGVPGNTVPEYRITGNQLWLIPNPPPANLQILVRYVPILADMVDVGTITIDGMVAGDSITIASSPVVPVAAPVNGVLPALTPQIRYLAIPKTSIRVITETEIQFYIGDDDVETAANLAAAMNSVTAFLGEHIMGVPWSTGSLSQDRSVASVTANGTVVTIQLLAPLAIVWSCLASGDDTRPADGVQLTPLPPATQANPYGAWANFCNVLNGMDELVIIDAAIKVKDKQQQDSSVLMRRKDVILGRLRTEANNRNAAQNGRITNVRRGRGRWGGGGGGFGYGWC